MKAKEQVLEHLLEVGYRTDEICKIMAYMIGAKMKEPNEVIKHKIGNNTFNDFLKWIHEKPKENKFKKIACSLEYFVDHNNSLSKEIISDVRENIDFLLKNADELQHFIDKKSSPEEKEKYDTEELSNILYRLSRGYLKDIF